MLKPKYIKLFTNTTEDAEESYHDFFMKLNTAVKSFSGGSSFSTWVYISGKRFLFDEHAKQKTNKKKQKASEEAYLQMLIEDFTMQNKVDLECFMALLPTDLKQKVDMYMQNKSENRKYKNAYTEALKTMRAMKNQNEK